jgi:uroporphyrinogen III methyltransferase/synthase
VTRAREQASELVKQLSELGAECLEFPTIEVVPPDDWKPLDAAIENLSLYDWLIFTSVNGVTFFFERLFSNNKDLRALNNLRTAAIGPATAKRLFEFGLRSDIVPESYRAESIVESFRKETIKDKRILLPRAKEARPILPEELRRMGAIVDEIAAYCTKEIRDNADDLLQQLEDRVIDMITFTSSSTVKNFKALIPKEKFEFLLEGVAIASIGPITADTAKKLGIEVHVTAESYTIPGLCKAIEHYFNKN